MLLYRQWLELRWRWVAILVLALFLALGLPGRIATLVKQFNETGTLIWAMQPYQDLRQPIGTEPFFIWHEYSELAFSIMLFAALLAFVSDVVSPPDLFALSLPVSRRRILWTRFVLTWFEIGAASLFLLTAAAVLTTQPLPWRALLLSNGTAWVALLPIVAAMQLAAVVSATRAVAVTLAAVALLPGLAILVRIGHGSLDALRDPTPSAPFIAWVILGTGLFCGLTVHFAKAREY